MTIDLSKITPAGAPQAPVDSIEPLRRNVSTRLGTWIERSINRQAMGEFITWDMGVAHHPEQGMIHLFSMFMPGGLLGTLVSTLVALPGASGMSQEDVEQVVTMMIANLHEQRAEQLKP